MVIIVVCALAVLLLFGSYLFRLEWKRFKVDKQPAPPPLPEEAALDRWNAGVVMLVAGLSVIGALMAFWASSEFSNGSNISQQALEESTQYQTVKAEQDGYVDFGASLAEIYQEHTMAESSLYSQAGSEWASNQSDEAELLEAQARVEGAQERALYPGFLCYYASGPGYDGEVFYDIGSQKASEQQFGCLQPDQDPTALTAFDPAHVDALESQAQNDRSKAAEIVLGGAFCIVSVFFLTLSYLGWRHRRARYLAPGIISIAIAMIISAVAGWA